MKSLILFCLLSTCLLVSGQSKLGTYDIDKSRITVSGISSGGAMATQLHVAFSSLIIGHGTIAGPPYYCAQGVLYTATSNCMSGSLFSTINVATLTSKANSYEKAGTIDSLSNLKNHRVYFYSGSKDTTVVKKVVAAGEDFFKAYMDVSRFKTVYNIASVHGHVTDKYGSACGTTDRAYINNCNYNQVHDIFTHLYPDLQIQRPASNYIPTGSLTQYDQKEFYPTGVTTSTLSMEGFGYVYVPPQCNTKQCRLHIALHGCLQAHKNIADIYVRNAGYNEVADLNDFIILYPQTTSNLVGNPNACWDWWGYSGTNYANNNGPQMKAIREMIRRVASV